jgi:hypothetical protein
MKTMDTSVYCCGMIPIINYPSSEDKCSIETLICLMNWLINMFNVLVILIDEVHFKRSLHAVEIDWKLNNSVTSCLSYPHRTIELINSFVHICQTAIPFVINIIATIIIIIKISRYHSISHIDQTYKQHLYKQFRQQKHLLITPFILVSLNIPRLVLSFIPTCMNTVRDPWFLLFTYLCAFVPPMLTFIIFVLPSKAYKDEFHRIIKRICSC